MGRIKFMLSKKKRFSASSKEISPFLNLKVLFYIYKTEDNNIFKKTGL